MSVSAAQQFAEDARRLGVAARAAGLQPPAFRSPPRDPARARTVTRTEGGAIVAVLLRQSDGPRAREAVLGDMAEGVLVANGVRPSDERWAPLLTQLLEAVR
jgi:hypothetical protein